MVLAGVVCCVQLSGWWLVKVGEVELVDWDFSVVVSDRPCSKCLAIGGECYTSGLLCLRI